MGSRSRHHRRGGDLRCAEKAARDEQRRVADQAKAIAGYSKQEAALNADLASALRHESSQAEREAKRRADQERRTRDRERARTDDLVAAAENRVAEAIEQLRAPKPEKLRILYLIPCAKASESGAGPMRERGQRSSRTGFSEVALAESENEIRPPRGRPDFAARRGGI
jgi:hypothetical protein